MNQLSPAEYDALTRQHYQDSVVAANYKAEYTGPARLRTLPARIVAARERWIIQRSIAHIVASSSVPNWKVLDLPCGTGKLAPVFSHFDFNVVAADISRQMMEMAAAEYEALSTFLGFVQADACATGFSNGEFHAVVCLRLLHRVPDGVRTAILHELSRIADSYVIVSAGMTDPVQAFRRRIRHTLTGKSTVPYPVTRRLFTAQLADAGLQPVHWIPVLPFVSSEWIVVAQKHRG